MRVLSFVDHLEFEFEGSIVKSAICLGDATDDGLNELIVGSENGDLAVYKGESSKPLYTANGLGMVTAIAVGDLLNVSHNVLVVVTGCGMCYIYDLSTYNDVKRREPEGKECKGQLGETQTLKPLHIQKIPANAKIILIGDVNGDGFAELVVGLTDRVVRTYNWVHTGEMIGAASTGKLIGLNKWEFADQIGSVTFNQSVDGFPCVLVAQPGGTYVTLKVKPTDPDTFDEHSAELLTKLSVEYEPLASSHMRNPNINTQICGNINIGSFDKSKADKDASPACILATLDGTLILVQDGKILWSFQVDHQLFSVDKIDLNGDGYDEIVACAWDGNTYIITSSTESVRFAFQEPVMSFTSGYYGFRGSQVPCLVYATFNNRIYLYNNISLTHVKPHTVSDVARTDPKYAELLLKLGLDPDDSDVVQKLNHFLFYGFKK